MTAASDPSGQLDDQLFDRSGHVTELALDRHLYDPHDAARDAALDRHLSTCDACREALAALRAEDAAFSLVAPGSIPGRRGPELAPARPPRARGRRIWRRAWWLAPLAVAAALLIALLTPVERAPDAHRLKGGALDLEVYAHDGVQSRRVSTGSIVHAGDRVGFRVKARRGGHLAIVGVDEEQHVYVCYPQDPSAVAVPLTATAEPVVLDAAVRFDAVLGHERLVAVFCDAPFAVEDVAGSLRAAAARAMGSDGPLPPLRAGCTQREVVLHKVGDIEMRDE